MTWKHKTVIRILLLIASMLAEESELRAEIKALGSHIAAELRA